MKRKLAEGRVTTEDLYRINRAIPIVFALICANISSHDAAKSHPGTAAGGGKDSADWKLAAQLAGMDDYCPGTTTQKLILKLLVDFEEMRLRFPQNPIRWPDAVKAAANPEYDYLKWAIENSTYQPKEMDRITVENEDYVGLDGKIYRGGKS